jgi:hypothetical protein
LQALELRRETSRVSFLMCPFCVRELLTTMTTSMGRVVGVALDPGFHGEKERAFAP